MYRGDGLGQRGVGAIQRFIDAWNDRCQPFTWTRDPDTVIVKATHPQNRKTQQTSDTDHEGPLKSPHERGGLTLAAGYWTPT